MDLPVPPRHEVFAVSRTQEYVVVTMRCAHRRSVTDVRSQRERASLRGHHGRVPCGLRGETIEDIIKQSAKHAHEEHGIADITPEVQQAVLAAIHDK